MSSGDRVPEWAAAPSQLPQQQVRVRKKRRRRRRHRTRNRLLFSLFVVLMAIGAAAAYLYLVPGRDALAIMRDAEQQVSFVQGQVRGGVGQLNATKLRTLQAAVARARQDVRTVQGMADDYAPLLDLAEALPYADRRVGNARALLRVATHALSSLDQMTGLAVAMVPESGSAHGGATRTLLRTLSRYRPTLQSALAEWQQAEAFAQPLQATTLLGASADHFLSVFDKQADQVNHALGTLLDVQALSSRGARFLLVSQNPDEQRATGGFIGFAALLHVDLSGVGVDHYLVSAKVDHQYVPNPTGAPDAPLPAGSVAAPLPGTYYANWEAWLFRDANWSPDFRVSARQLQQFYRRGQGIAPDGVIAVEPQMLARLLAITGPVAVPGTSLVLTATTALTQLHYTEYVLNNKVITLSAWRAIVAKLFALPSATMFRAVQVFGEALRDRQVLVYADDAGIETQLAHNGLDGAVTHGSADYLYVVDSNLGYTKTDPYIRRSVVDSIARAHDGSVTHNLTITYANTWPPNRVLPKDAGGKNTTYLDYLRVLAPAGAVDLGSSGWERWATSVADGRTVFAGALSIGAGQTGVAHLHYRVPARVFHGGPFAIHVDAQPGGYAATMQLCLAGKTTQTCRLPSNLGFDWTVSQVE